MKAVKISKLKWLILLEQLHKDYPSSVLAIRDKTKRVLGFTSRAHREWIANPNYDELMKQYGAETIYPPDKGRYVDMVHLDFYSEEKRTFFLLKYSEFLS